MRRTLLNFASIDAADVHVCVAQAFFESQHIAPKLSSRSKRRKRESSDTSDDEQQSARQRSASKKRRHRAKTAAQAEPNARTSSSNHTSMIEQTERNSDGANERDSEMSASSPSSPIRAAAERSPSAQPARAARSADSDYMDPFPSEHPHHRSQLQESGYQSRAKCCNPRCGAVIAGGSQGTSLRQGCVAYRMLAAYATLLLCSCDAWLIGYWCRSLEEHDGYVELPDKPWFPNCSFCLCPGCGVRTGPRENVGPPSVISNSTMR